MYRLLIHIIILLFFLPTCMHAQKEDFLPPKLNKKTQKVENVQTRRTGDTKASPSQGKQEKEKASPEQRAPKEIKKKSIQEPAQKSAKKPAKKPSKEQHYSPKDTMPTPGFIRYIPKK